LAICRRPIFLFPILFYNKGLMGFPPWTLWGMGLSVAGALIILALSLLAQSPQALKRIGLGGSQLDRRARSLTSYAFALLIVALGFFLAGVPISTPDEPVVQSGISQTPPTATGAADTPAETSVDTPAGTPAGTPALTPVTGAFGGPPPELISPTAGASITSSTSLSNTTPAPITTLPAENGIAAATATPSQAANTPTNTAPTPTPRPTETPTPTETPRPTLTPTPITGETAVVDIGGGNVWLHRSPGGQNLLILSSGDIVILMSGRANQGGILWQEVMTVNGIVGWLQESYLVFEST
jgi:hypothetical protein